MDQNVVYGLESKDIFEHMEYKLNIYKTLNVEKVKNLITLSDLLGFCLDIEEDIVDLRSIINNRINLIKKMEEKQNGEFSK